MGKIKNKYYNLPLDHIGTYTEKEFMKQNEWKKIGKLEKKGSKTLQWVVQKWDSCNKIEWKKIRNLEKKKEVKPFSGPYVQWWDS